MSISVAMELRIEDQIFELFPELVVGVVVVSGADNGSVSSEVAQLLTTATQRVRDELSVEDLVEDPRIECWREAYRKFRGKPKKYKSSIENLCAMILNGRSLGSINPLVDLYNFVSLSHMLPVGGDDLDKVDGAIVLGLACGDERFVPLNCNESVSPKPGEVVYRDDSEVLCRRWNWRECNKSKLTEASSNVALVIEGLPPATTDSVRAATDELGRLVGKHCGGKARVQLLSATRRSIDL